MSIRKKIFVYVAAFFAAMSVVTFVFQRSIIYKSFLKIENDEVADNIRRVFRSFEREIFHQEKTCRDWAQWDDTYRFIDDPFQAYKDSNLIFETFRDNQINAMIFFKNDGTVVWGKSYDLVKETEGPMDIAQGGRLDPSHPVLDLKSQGEKAYQKVSSGVLDTSHGLMIFVTVPITHSDGSGPAKGMLTIGRFIDTKMIESLREQTQLEFSIDFPLTEEKIRSIQANHKAFVEKDFTFYTLAHKDYTEVRVFYPDIYGKPVFSAFYRFPREITRQGLLSIRSALLLLIISALVFSVLLMVFLQTRLIGPLRRLTTQSARVRAEDNYNLRLNMSSKDEIGMLAKSFDFMIQTIGERTNDLKAANEKLLELSRLDGLTGIPNRRTFDAGLDLQWRQMSREKKPLSLIIADVDYFKKFNDRYGHQKGDECLIEVAGIIAKNARRPSDLAVRYGGEEFGVILPDTDEEGSFLIAERIRKEIFERNIRHEETGIDGRITISLGVGTIIPGLGEDLSRFIQRVDQTMYYSKTAGRNRTSRLSTLPPA